MRNTTIKEHIISFSPGQFSQPEIFRVELTGITYPNPQYHIHRDTSRIYCLEYVMAGQGCVQVEGRSFYPQQGDVYLLPKNQSHDYCALPEDPWTKIWMNVSGSLCDGLIKAYHLENTILFPSCPVLPAFEHFVTLCQRAGTENPQLSRDCSLLFHDILIQMQACLPGKTAACPDKAAHHLKDFIDSHLYEKIRIEDLAAFSHLSPTHLTRLFKKEFHQTPYDYLLDLKINAARLFLTDTMLSVKEIAYRLNFADEHYFSHLFKGKTGQTPTGYRKASGKSIL